MWSADRRRRRRPRRVGALLVLGAAVCGLAWSFCLGPVLAQGTGGDAQTREKQLSDLKQEIEENRREIDKLKSREKNLSRLQERIGRDHELTQRYLRQLETQDLAIRSDLAGRQADLFDKELALSETAQRLRRGLVRYYKMRSVGGPELFFSARTFGELFARSQYVARLVYRERLELESLATERQQLAENAATLEGRRREVEGLQLEKRREEERLQRQGAAANAELGELRDERTTRERRVRELEEAQAAIRRMIERMEQERLRGKEQGKRPAFAGDLGPMRGHLDWPVRGDVLSDFGYEVHPKYGTRVKQNGIDIAAAEGTPIRAVAPGVAVYVDWLPGYGRTVILDHGSGYYTLYAHASSVSVARGAKVKEGQVIAAVGDTDSVKGTCLHFEVRQGEKALNPREWLR
jgi:murein hydrolase activator